MRAPKFWNHGSHSPISSLLTPLAWVYKLIYLQRYGAVTPEILTVPIICVGNATVGGAGKTPTVIAIAKQLQASNINTHVLSRGYGGSLEGPVQVSSEHRAHEVGDEPLLIAQTAPCWIAKRRMLAAISAIRDGAEMLLMDDGFQNPSLHKHLSILVIDGGFGFGNGKCLPAGPLREPLAFSLAKADVAIIIGEDSCNIAQQLPESLPTVSAMLVPQIDNTNPLHPKAGDKVVAFAGIGRPEKFYNTLREIGCEIIAAQDFDDHHPYGAADIAALEALATKHNASLVTTEKDCMRLPEPLRSNVLRVPISLQINDSDSVLQSLLNATHPSAMGGTA